MASGIVATDRANLLKKLNIMNVATLAFGAFRARSLGSRPR